MAWEIAKGILLAGLIFYGASFAILFWRFFLAIGLLLGLIFAIIAIFANGLTELGIFLMATIVGICIILEEIGKRKQNSKEH